MPAQAKGTLTVAGVISDGYSDLQKMRDYHSKKSLHITASCGLDDMIQPHMSEEDRQKIAALMIKYGEMDQRLEKQTKVLKELEKNVRTNQHLPKFTDYAEQRMQAFETANPYDGRQHHEVAGYLSEVDARSSFLGDDELQVMHDESTIITIDPYSKGRLVEPYRSAKCPARCVFNKQSVDEMFRTAHGATMKCPCCDRKISKANMKLDTKLQGQLANLDTGGIHGAQLD